MLGWLEGADIFVCGCVNVSLSGGFFAKFPGNIAERKGVIYSQ